MLLKDDLFKLVKAMSKSEKRYFSLDAQKSGKKGSRYLEVFRFLSDMDEFNDERLKKKFPKNLSSDKSYLYDAILRSMRDYRSTKSKAAQIKEKIQDSRYLFERGLYKQCDSRLQEANDIAKELGDELMILEVARERLLTIKSNKEKNFAEYVESLLEDKEKALTNVNQFFKYSDAYYETIVKVTKNFQSPAEEREQIVLPDFFEKEEAIIESPQTLRRLYQSKALYYQLKGDKENLLKYFKKTADWWMANPALKNEEYHRYITDTSSLIYAYIKNDKFDEAKIYIDYLKENKPNNKHEERVWLRSTYSHQIMLWLNVKDYKSAKSYVAEIDENILKYGFDKNHVLLGNIGILYFLMQDYEKSRKWFSKIVASKNTQLRKDIQVLVRVLNLVCLYEFEDTIKLENEVRSVFRFFKLNNISKGQMEYDILTRLNQIFKAPYFEKPPLTDETYSFFKQNFKKEGSRDDIIEPLMYWLQPIEVVTPL